MTELSETEALRDCLSRLSQASLRIAKGTLDLDTVK